MREPLPIACRSSAAFAEAFFADRDAEKRARGAWETAYKREGEDKDEHHRLVWDGVRSFDDLIAEAPRADEAWASEPSRFGSYAVRLWGDLLSHERDREPMSRIGEAPAFDVCGELPSGVTVLEASAGTGKTYAIAALAARYVADGIPIDHLLMVTFGRMATGELRERVRRQLNATERALGRALAGAAADAADPVIALLTDGRPRSELATRRSRLRRALADFDSATIATTHGFCQGVLQSIGMAADLDPDVDVRRRPRAT